MFSSPRLPLPFHVNSLNNSIHFKLCNFIIIILHTGGFCGRVWQCLCVSSPFQTEGEYVPEHQIWNTQIFLIKNWSEKWKIKAAQKSVISLCDGSVNVWYDDTVVPVPQVDGSLAATGALVLSGHTEHHLVGSVSQLQLLLKWEK